MPMTPEEKLLAEIISDRFDRGDTKTQIRADLEAERGKPFTEEEWATLVFASAFAGATRNAQKEKHSRLFLFIRGIVSFFRRRREPHAIFIHPKGGTWEAVDEKGRPL